MDVTMDDYTAMMVPVRIPIRLKDGHRHPDHGRTAYLTVNEFHASRLNLANGLYYPFQRGDGSWIMFIQEDGLGKVMEGRGGHTGMSLPHLISGRPNFLGYYDNDCFNNTWANLVDRKKTTERLAR